MPLIPALWRQRQVDSCEFEASPVYRVSSRIQRNLSGRKRGWRKRNHKAHYRQCWLSRPPAAEKVEAEASQSHRPA